jgi:hypothetical protein
MNQCRQCGATLAENSTVCLQCGTENTASAARVPGAAQSDLDFLKPALMGGAALGLLSAIPIVNFVNCFCCIWVLAGGGLASWQLDKQRPGSLTYGDGALVGGLSGLIGAVVATLVGVPLQMLLMTPERMVALIERFVPNLPDQARQQIMDGFQLSLSSILLQLVMNMVLFGLFALAGGILTVAILNRNKTE